MPAEQKAALRRSRAISAPAPIPEAALPDDDTPLRVQPAFASVDGWRQISGMSRSSTYRALAAGDMKAVKIGRALRIDVVHGLGWLRSLPAAQMTPSPRKSA